MKISLKGAAVAAMAGALFLPGSVGSVEVGPAKAPQDPFGLEKKPVPDPLEQYNGRLQMRKLPSNKPEMIQMLKEASERLKYLHAQADRGIAFAKARQGEDPRLAEAALAGVQRWQKEIEEEYTVLVMQLDKSLLGREEPQNPPPPPGAAGAQQQKQQQQTGQKPGDPASDAYNDRWGMQYGQGEEKKGPVQTHRWGQLPPRVRESLVNNQNESLEDPRYEDWFKKYTEALEPEKK